MDSRGYFFFTFYKLLFTIPSRSRPDLGCRSQSTVLRTKSRANHTDEQRDIENDNSRIGNDFCVKVGVISPACKCPQQMVPYPKEATPS